MSVLAAAALLLAPGARPGMVLARTAHVDPPRASVGVMAASPEVMGMHLSVFPQPYASLDLRLTVTALDAGVTLHLPVAERPRPAPVRYDALVGVLAGTKHATAPHGKKGTGDARLGAMGGFGLKSSGIDARLGAGLWLQAAPSGWTRQLALQLVLAWLI